MINREQCQFTRVKVDWWVGRTSKKNVKRRHTSLNWVDGCREGVWGQAWTIPRGGSISVVVDNRGTAALVTSSSGAGRDDVKLALMTSPGWRSGGMNEDSSSSVISSLSVCGFNADDAPVDVITWRNVEIQLCTRLFDVWIGVWSIVFKSISHCS